MIPAEAVYRRLVGFFIIYMYIIILYYTHFYLSRCTVAYTIRFFGAIIGAAFGAVLYNADTDILSKVYVPIWGIFLINAIVPIVLISPFVYSLVESNAEEPPAIKVQLNSIWVLVQRKAVWKPCTFIFIYNMLLLTNPAWNTFLVDGLGTFSFSILIS